MPVTIDRNPIKKRVFINPKNGEEIDKSQFSKIRRPNMGPVGEKKTD
jgi:hypothetical protein